MKLKCERVRSTSPPSASRAKSSRSRSRTPDWVPTVERGFDVTERRATAIGTGSPSIRSTSARPSFPKNWRALGDAAPR